jgi:hypothetical protein
MLRVAVSFVPSVAVGENVTVNVHKLLVSSVLPQVVVSLKSLALGPEMLAPVSVIVLTLLFVKVVLRPELVVPCGTEPKASDVGLRETVPPMKVVTLSAGRV